ncbi:MAG: hemolysin III family protein [bacterium]|nr:MAG: hemolysin III family protein [bacterium]
MTSTTSRPYTLAEEIASTVTHGLGAAFGITALAVLTSLAAGSGDAWKIVSLAIYGSTLVAMYLSSVLYHSFQRPRIKVVFRYFDHAAIYLLIAGTYTPFTLVNLRGPWGWSLFGLIWGLALSGIVMTVLGVGRSRLLASLVYIAMGWLVVIAVKPLYQSIPTGGIVWLVAGGLLYTSGVLFYVWKRLPFNHTVWHLFVLAGSVCHFFAVLFYVLPG